MDYFTSHHLPSETQLPKQVLNLILWPVHVCFSPVMQVLHLSLSIYSMLAPLEHTTKQIVSMTQELVYSHCRVGELRDQMQTSADLQGFTDGRPNGSHPPCTKRIRLACL